MKKTIKAESLMEIIIGVFILSFVLLWIWNIMFYSKDIISNYQDIQKINILENNTLNIIKSIDTDNINENETFYIYKNNASKIFEVFTWASNEEYKYINEYWNKVNTGSFEWNIYKRTLIKQEDNNDLWVKNKIITVSIENYVKD